MSKIFSLPFYTQMDTNFFYKEFVPFLQQYHTYIYDIYFTYNMPPFMNDAMGTANMAEHSKEGIESQNKRIFDVMMQIQKKFKIKVSATFNNILVDPTSENLDLFIQNLKPLYEKGLRSVTIPHYSWMLHGKIKREFPELTIKNTILKKVSKAQEYVDYAKVGFDIINIDRYNLRDRDNLIRLKKAYDRYKVPMVILANEWCKGLCPAMDEHYHYNCSGAKECSNAYFTTSIGCATCPSWQNQIPWYNLQNANLPMKREDIDELLEYIQILKLHGRNDFTLMRQSMDIIKRYADGNNIVFDEFYKYIQSQQYDLKKFEKWNKFIKNCKFECWDCQMCEELHNSRKNMELSF